MSTLQISQILGRLDELRALFVLGQRAVPFLEEMFFFLKDVSSLLDDINDSIRESTVKMMPHATSRLESVSQATEMATTEILDLADSALDNVWKLKKRVEESTTDIDAIAKIDARMIRMLRAALRGEDDVLLAKVEMLHQQKRAIRRRLGEQTCADVDALNVINEKLNHIVLSLQVQDITAQQLAAVNHLIESIRERMGSLMSRMGTGDFVERGSAPRRFAAFDPNAKYDRSGKKQRVADEVMATFDETSADAPSSTPASQGEIDQLFAGRRNSGGDSGPASQGDIDQLFAGKGSAASPKEDRKPSAPASQDSIDKLFNAPGGGVASQDDIDKLFGA